MRFTNKGAWSPWQRMGVKRKGNAENRLDPKKRIPLFDMNGNVAGLGVIQSSLDNYNSGPKLVVFGRNGKQFGVSDGYDGAMRAGLSAFKPGKSKGGAGTVGYRLSSSDISILTKYATFEDEMGNKGTDHAADAVSSHAAYEGKSLIIASTEKASPSFKSEFAKTSWGRRKVRAVAPFKKNAFLHDDLLNPGVGCAISARGS